MSTQLLLHMPYFLHKQNFNNMKIQVIFKAYVYFMLLVTI